MQPFDYMYLRDDSDAKVKQLWSPQKVEWFEEAGYPGDMNYFSKDLGVSRGLATPEQKKPLMDASLAELRESELVGEPPAGLDAAMVEMTRAMIQEDVFEIWNGSSLIGLMGIDGTQAELDEQVEIVLEPLWLYVEPGYRGRNVAQALLNTVGHGFFSSTIEEVFEKDFVDNLPEYEIVLKPRTFGNILLMEVDHLDDFMFGSFNIDMLQSEVEEMGGMADLVARYPTNVI